MKNHHTATESSPAIHTVIEAMAKEQMLFLMNHYRMGPEEMIHLYTGEQPEFATYEAALQTIIAHRTTADFSK